MAFGLSKEKQAPPFHVYPLGDAAIVLQFGNEISDTIFSRIKSFTNYLEEHPFPGMVEFVPAFTTLTIYYNPWLISEKGRFDPYARAIAHVQEILPEAVQKHKQKNRVVEIPVCYGGAFGPDLEQVASLNRITPQQVIKLHTGTDYKVHMVGFAPGFPYLGGLHKKINAPRMSTPRPQVPAGSVGIAGNQTGIYPIETPGGWQLIGRTPLALFTPHATHPTLLHAGDTVRFISISAEEFKEIQEQQHEH